MTISILLIASFAVAGTTFGAGGGPREETIPAHIYDHPEDAICPTSVQWPLTTGWEVASHTRYTIVLAGGYAPDSDDGAFCIFRQNLVTSVQGSDLVRVKGTGPVRITRAPEGFKVRRSAQRKGRIYFTSRRHIHGVLRLRNDTVRKFDRR